MDVISAAEQIGKEMERIEKKRENVIASSRSIIRATKKIIHSIHVGEEYGTAVNDLKKDVLSLKGLESELVHSAEDALMEYSETCIFAAVVEKRDVPTYSELNVMSRAWALGLADSLGEIRRMILNLLLAGDKKNAEYLFKRMETICEAVMSFDVPDAILPIRRKQDVARSVTEKTRTDLVYSSLRS